MAITAKNEANSFAAFNPTTSVRLFVSKVRVSSPLSAGSTLLCRYDLVLSTKDKSHQIFYLLPSKLISKIVWRFYEHPVYQPKLYHHGYQTAANPQWNQTKVRAKPVQKAFFLLLKQICELNLFTSSQIFPTEMRHSGERPCASVVITFWLKF